MTKPRSSAERLARIKWLSLLDAARARLSHHYERDLSREHENNSDCSFSL
jgi:hypothetical protein